MSSTNLNKHMFKTDSNILTIIENIWPGFYCTLDNLRRPTFDFLMRFVIRLLTDLKMVNEDILKLEKKWQSKNTEPVTDLTEIMVVYKPLDSLLRKVNFKEFKLMDLVIPSNETAIGMIKSVLNLVLFRYGVLDVMESQLSEIDKERDAYEDMLQSISHFQQMIEDFNSNETDYNQQLNKLREMSDCLETEAKLIVATVTGLTEKIKSAELNIQKKQKISDELQQQINKLKTEESTLTDQIVENSTQVQEKYDNFVKLKNELKEKQIQQKEMLDQQHNLISVCESIINKYNELLDDCKILFLTTDKYIANLKLSAQMEKQETDHNQQIQQVHEKISSALVLSETLESTRRQKLIINEEKKKKSENELIPFQLEYENAKKRQKELKVSYDEIVEEINLLQTATAQYEKNYKRLHEFYDESFRSIKKKVNAMDQYANDELSKLLIN